MSVTMFANTRDNFVENIPTFRRYKNPFTICVIPEIHQNRKLTDVPCLMLFVISVIALVSLWIYTSLSADISRIIIGYDNCGNVCGRRNEYVNGISCSGMDMTEKPFLQYKFDINYTNGELAPEKCVKECGQGYDEGLNRCYPKGYSHGDSHTIPSLIEAIEDHYLHLIALCSIGLGFAIIEILLFKYFTKFVIQSVMIMTILFFLALSILFWYFYAGPIFEEKPEIYLALAIIFTIITLIVSLVILVMLSRINLITFLFQETINAMFTIPLIILEPLLTFIANLINIALFIFITLICLSSGTLRRVKGSSDYFDYIPDEIPLITFVCSILMMLWCYQFIYACQHLIISGAVSAVYFSRDRFALKSPIFNSFYNLLKFHLGSVLFGSLTITLIEILKWIIHILTKGRYRRIGCCVEYLEGIFKYLTSLGYIEVAIHGQSLCRSSVRGLTLIVTNFLSAFVVNSIGDYVILMIEILIIAGTVGAGLLMNDNSEYYWIVIVSSVIVTFIFTHSFFVAFKISLDTIFICFCEDQLINDGVNSPYYTTANFYKYLIKAQKYELQKQALKQKKWK